MSQDASYAERSNFPGAIGSGLGSGTIASVASGRPIFPWLVVALLVLACRPRASAPPPAPAQGATRGTEPEPDPSGPETPGTPPIAEAEPPSPPKKSFTTRVLERAHAENAERDRERLDDMMLLWHDLECLRLEVKARGSEEPRDAESWMGFREGFVVAVENFITRMYDRYPGIFEESNMGKFFVDAATVLAEGYLIAYVKMDRLEVLTADEQYDAIETELLEYVAGIGWEPPAAGPSECSPAVRE